MSSRIIRYETHPAFSLKKFPPCHFFKEFPPIANFFFFEGIPKLFGPSGLLPYTGNSLDGLNDSVRQTYCHIYIYIGNRSDGPNNFLKGTPLSIKYEENPSLWLVHLGRSWLAIGWDGTIFRKFKQSSNTWPLLLKVRMKELGDHRPGMTWWVTWTCPACATTAGLGTWAGTAARAVSPWAWAHPTPSATTGSLTGWTS